MSQNFFLLYGYENRDDMFDSKHATKFRFLMLSRDIVAIVILFSHTKKQIVTCRSRAIVADIIKCKYNCLVMYSKRSNRLYNKFIYKTV